MATETVRFSRVVEKSGQPESYTLWLKPEQDKAFTALLRQDRVMTVHQETTGAKADYGSVGYAQDRHRSLLVFPKSLKAFAGKRIVGIKYEELKGVSSAESEPAPARKKTAQPKPSPPKKPFPAPKLHKPAPDSKVKASKVKEEKAAAASPPPPENQIPFPKPEVAGLEKSEIAENFAEEAAEDLAEKVAEDLAGEVARLKKAVKKALDALAKDKSVTAFNLLKEALGAED